MKKLFTFLSISAVVFTLSACQTDSWKNNPELKKYTNISQEEYLEKYEYLTDETHIFKSVSYEEVISVFDENKTAVLYLGGSWCPNCQAAVPFINLVAKELGIQEVLNFDPRIGGNTSEYDIRKINNKDQEQLYKKLVRLIQYRSPVGERAGETKLSLLRVPAVVVVKDGVVQTIEYDDMIQNALVKEYKYDSERDLLEQEFADEYKMLLIDYLSKAK